MGECGDGIKAECGVVAGPDTELRRQAREARHETQRRHATQLVCIHVSNGLIVGGWWR